MNINLSPQWLPQRTFKLPLVLTVQATTPWAILLTRGNFLENLQVFILFRVKPRLTHLNTIASDDVSTVPKLGTRITHCSSGRMTHTSRHVYWHTKENHADASTELCLRLILPRYSPRALLALFLTSLLSYQCNLMKLLSWEIMLSRPERDFPARATSGIVYQQLRIVLRLPFFPETAPLGRPPWAHPADVPIVVMPTQTTRLDVLRPTGDPVPRWCSKLHRASTPRIPEFTTEGTTKDFSKSHFCISCKLRLLFLFEFCLNFLRCTE